MGHRINRLPVDEAYPVDRDAGNTSAPLKMSSGYEQLKGRPLSTCSQGEEKRKKYISDRK